MPLSSAIGLDDLRHVFLIAEAGGVSAAARTFGVSKATLSSALTRLEDRAHGPLFDRMSTGVRLTPAGETLLAAARQATEAGSAADEALRAVTEEPRGLLRVAASALSGQQLLGPTLARRTRDYPQVTARIAVTAAGPDRLEDNLDLVLRLGRPDKPYLIARRIVGTRMKLYCGQSLAAAHDVTDPASVEDLPRVCIDVPGAPVDWHMRAEAGPPLVLDAPPRAYVGDPTVALGLIRAGAGMAMLPALFGDAQVARGEIAVVLPGHDMGLIEIFAVFPPRRASIPAVRVFIDYLIAQAQQMTGEVAADSPPARSG